MNRILRVIQYIAFTIAGILIFNLFLTSNIEFQSAKGLNRLQIETVDTDTPYADSYIFNQMFGISVSDVINYAAMENNLNDIPSKDISVSANSLGINPDKYNRYSDCYKYGDSNISYYLCSIEENNRHVVNNLDVNTKNIVAAKDHIIENSSMYLYYDYNGNFETNTKITKGTIDELFKRNEGYFGDEVSFAIGLNKIIENVDSNDPYYLAINRYFHYSNYYYLKLVILILCIFVYVILLIILTGREGVIVDKDTGSYKIKTYAGDYLPFEVRLLLFAALSLPYYFLIVDSYIAKQVYGYINYLLDNDYNKYLTLLIVVLMITSILISYFYYGLVRRVKSGLIIKTSLLVNIMTKTVKALNKSVKNWPDLLKSAIPLLAILLINLLGGLFFNNTLLIVIIAIIDILALALVFVGARERTQIINVIKSIANGNLKNKIDVSVLHGDNIKLGEAVNSIGESVNIAVEKSMKDERMKADLITNVSHDLKTPLTSIINYVDLLKKENIDNDRVINYINILDEKSQRLKQLTDDLVEASKISSGNVVLNMERINIKELMVQAIGEFSDKFDEKKLSVVDAFADDLYVSADSRSMFRIVENLFTNIYKYALEGTRVYIDGKNDDSYVVLSVKNISRNPLNISVDELTERFTRGDESRTTEGSGLGLSIAKSLTEAMHGKFELELDGDLFKVIMKFPKETQVH